MPKQALARIDVVAGRQHEAHVVRVDGRLQRVADLALSLGRTALADADAEVADDGKRERRRERLIRRGMRAKPMT